MNEPEESPPAPDHRKPRAPIPADVAARLSKIEQDIAKILAIAEAPHLAEIERQTQQAENARKLDQAYASGELGHLAG